MNLIYSYTQSLLALETSKDSRVIKFALRNLTFHSRKYDKEFHDILEGLKGQNPNLNHVDKEELIVIISNRIKKNLKEKKMGKVKKLKPITPVEIKLARTLMRKHSDRFYVIGATTLEYPVTAGRDIIENYVKPSSYSGQANRAGVIADYCAKLYSTIKIDWSVTVFIFHRDEGLEYVEVSLTNMDSSEVEGEVSRLRDQLWSEADECTRLCSGFFTVPSANYRIDSELTNILRVFNTANVWDETTVLKAMRQHALKAGDDTSYIDNVLTIHQLEKVA